MLTYHFCGGRLGENISFIYGLFKFCKLNNIPYDNIIIDINYKSSPLVKTEKPQYVFKDNMEMFSNIKYIFKEIPNNYFDNFQIIDLKCKDDIAQFKYFYLYNDIDKSSNIKFKNYWSLSDYWISHDPFFDIQLLNYICRPKKLLNNIRDKYKNIFKKKTAAIHIRRGDYLAIENKDILIDKCLLNNFNDFFGGKKLYKVEEIDYKIKEYLKEDYNILIFSDDIEWCRNNFSLYNNVYFYNNKPYEDMILMSLCDDVIIHKGSFFSKVAYLLSKNYKGLYV